MTVRSDDPSSSLHGPGERLAVHGFHSVWRLRDDREIGLVQLDAAPLDRLLERLRGLFTCQVGVSGVFTDLGETPMALHAAELVLATLPRDRPLVAAVDDRLPESLLVTNPMVGDRIRARALAGLDVLDVAKRHVLLDTLECWFRNGRSAADTAAELFCHRNTVLHRLERFEALSGLRLADDRDDLLVRLALLAPTSASRQT